MVLAFKKEFVPKILNGTKIHTIRKDSTDRWEEGNKIHYATGVRTKNYNCFKEGECISIQNIELKYSFHNVFTHIRLYIDNNLLGLAHIEKCVVTSATGYFRVIASNDGFVDVNDFLEWFPDDFKGKIIHWTDKKYKSLVFSE